MLRSATAQAGRKSVTAPQTQGAEEIIAGRLTQTERMRMLVQEEAVDAVAELMEELLSRVMDSCFRVDIKRQLVPFTTAWVKNWVVQRVEQQFLCRDEGDDPEDVMTEDSEPESADPDAWAQGCVPLVIPSQPLQPISPKEQRVQVEAETELLPKSRMIPQPDVSPKLSTKQISPKAVGEKIHKLNNPFPLPKMDLKKSYQDPVHISAGKFLPPLSHSTEKNTLKTEIANRTSCVNSHVTALLRQHNKPPAIQKLDPASLPDHCIFPSYEIIANHSGHKNAKETKLMQRQKKLESDWTVKSKRKEADVRPQNTSGHKTEGIVTSGPLRLDAMILAKGVSFSNAQAVELKQPTGHPPTPPVKLKPIRSDPAVLMFSVDQFVVESQVTPLSQSCDK